MVGFGVAICPRETDQSHFFLSSGDNQKNTEKFPSE